MMRKTVAAYLIITVLLFSCKKSEPVIDVVDFENLALNSSGFWNGSDGSGGFSSGNITFVNRYNAQDQAWSGFSYTNHSDTVTKDNTNIFSSVTGTGASGSQKYGVYHFSGKADTLIFDVPEKITEIVFSNTTYSYYSIKNGNPACKKFGGTSGNDQDWFKISLFPINADNVQVGYVDIYMADYRFTDNKSDYIANAWTNIDLSLFGFIKALKIEMSSSDTGAGGMNNPSFFCIDNIRGELEATSK